jgi:integrase
VSEIDVKLVDAYRAHKVAEREHIKDMIKAGTPLRDASGRRIRPLGNETINKTLGLLASILDVAVDHEILSANPARGRRRRLKATRPRRPFLEADEVQSLLQAAEQLDRDRVQPTPRALWIKHLRDEQGLTYIDIENDYNIPRGSAHYLYERATNDRPVVLVRRAIVAVLVGSGLRVSEMCALTWRDVNLDKSRLNVTDAKTPTGVREVELSPWLVDELRTYRAAISDLTPDSPVLPSARGTARDRKGVCNNVVKKAVARADRIQVAAGGSPLPQGITPHALRCTYISLLLESGHPLPYVMAQVGHADESTTLQIYARVMKRRPREAQHAAFDALIVGGGS